MSLCWAPAAALSTKLAQIKLHSTARTGSWRTHCGCCSHLAITSCRALTANVVADWQQLQMQKRNQLQAECRLEEVAKAVTQEAGRTVPPAAEPGIGQLTARQLAAEQRAERLAKAQAACKTKKAEVRVAASRTAADQEEDEEESADAAQSAAV